MAMLSTGSPYMTMAPWLKQCLSSERTLGLPLYSVKGVINVS